MQSGLSGDYENKISKGHKIAVSRIQQNAAVGRPNNFFSGIIKISKEN